MLEIIKEEYPWQRLMAAGKFLPFTDKSVSTLTCSCFPVGPLQSNMVKNNINRTYVHKWVRVRIEKLQQY